MTLTEGLGFFVNMIKDMANTVDIPIALHLDHGNNFDIIMAAIKAGYSSVMIDASHEVFEENMRITKDIVRIAHAAGVSVEAELGQLSGIEDNVEAAENVLVNVRRSKRILWNYRGRLFCSCNRNFSWCIQIQGWSKIRLWQIEKVKEVTGKPLVLHGASSVVQEYVKIAEEYGADFGGSKGVPADVLKQTVEYGINKVNTDTDLRIAYVAGLREFLAHDAKQFDPRKYQRKAMDYVKKVVMERIDILGSANKI